MTLNSMTGFARQDGEFEANRWHWELRSVNGRNFDLRFRLPPGIDALEPGLRAIAGKYLKRGSCQIGMMVSEAPGEANLEINEAALAKIVARASALAAEHGEDALAPARIDGLLALRGMVQIAEGGLAHGGELEPALETALLESFEAGVKALARARGEEGARLGAVIAGQIDQIAALVEAARTSPARNLDAIKSRLAEQVARLTEAGGGLDPDRLHQEAVLLATRGDMTEEIDRLDAHVEAARALLEASEPVGRKFEFLVQEFNREANTLCSKSNAAELTAIGLELKAVIDQTREQVLNIE